MEVKNQQYPQEIRWRCFDIWKFGESPRTGEHTRRGRRPQPRIYIITVSNRVV